VKHTAASMNGFVNKTAPHVHWKAGLDITCNGMVRTAGWGGGWGVEAVVCRGAVRYHGCCGNWLMLVT